MSPSLKPSPLLVDDSLPAELVAVVRLFDQHLGDVRFPDLDAERLRGLAADVTRANLALDRAREALEAAEREAGAAVVALAGAAQRGLAYARIYAEEPAREPLRAAIAEASSPLRSVASAPTGKKRGRPRKVAVDAAPQGLFAEPEASERFDATASIA